MNFKPAICPNCGGKLQVPLNLKTVKCMYCGVQIVVQEAIRVSSRVKEFTKTMKIYRTATVSDLPKSSNTLINLFIFNIFALIISFCGFGSELGKFLVVLLTLSAITLLISGVVQAFIRGMKEKKLLKTKFPSGILDSYKGQCPYCESNITLPFRLPAADCRYCKNRIIIRNAKFYSVDTPLSGLSQQSD